MLEKEVDIHEFIECINVPEIKNIFFLKMEEVKAGPALEYIEHYRARKNECRRDLFDNANNTEKREDEPGLQWFVLTLFRYSGWQITEMAPEPPYYISTATTIPIDIIEQISDSAVDPHKVITMEEVYSAKAVNFYDLQFVRFSSNNLFGTIRENIRRKDEMYAKMSIPAKNRMELALAVFHIILKEFPPIAKMFIDGMLDLGLELIAAEMKVRQLGGAPAAGVPKRKRKKKKKR